MSVDLMCDGDAAGSKGDALDFVGKAVFILDDGSFTTGLDVLQEHRNNGLEGHGHGKNFVAFYVQRGV